MCFSATMELSLKTVQDYVFPNAPDILRLMLIQQLINVLMCALISISHFKIIEHVSVTVRASNYIDKIQLGLVSADVVIQTIVMLII